MESHFNDNELVTKIAKGDHSAFKEIYTRYFKELYRYCTN